MRVSKRKGSLLLFFLLLVFWIIIASNFDLSEIIIGAVASILIVLYNLDLVFTKEEATKVSFKSIGALFVVGYTLLVEIIKANFTVVKIVLSKKMDITPGFESIRQPMIKNLNQTFYANAITLTPGTLTIDMSDTEILVHGLQLKHIHELEGSKLEKAFMMLEESEK